MSQQGNEPSSGSDEGGGEGLDGLQEANLDSVTGGGNAPEPNRDLQEAQPDTIEKSEDPSDYETKESGGGDVDAGEGEQ